MKRFDIPILIVGAGPVGLALAGDLGWRGIPCLVIERSDGTIYQPRQDLVGIRTMEFCRRWGIVGDVEASPYPRDYPQDNIYVAGSLAEGWEIGRYASPSMTDSRPPPQSPQRRERCPQNMFDPVLRKFAERHDWVELRYLNRFVDYHQDEDGVTVEIEDVAAERIYRLRSRWLVGCDGGASAVRGQMGVQMLGNSALTYTTNVIFRCAGFETLHPLRPGYRFIFVGPEGTWATIVAINGRDQWRFSIIRSGEAFGAPDETAIRAAIRRAVGRDFDYEILSVVPWTRRELVAERYSEGHVFIAGDAAHVVSPTGGFGMNTGVGDAVDLSWKLAAWLEGWGGGGLLESYTTERRPVAERNSKEASGNLARMLSPGENPGLLDRTDDGARLRERVGRDLSQAMLREWSTLGIHLGYVYEGSPIVVPDGSPPPIADHAIYDQTARSGSRAPHIWLADGRSTLDLFGRSFVLLALGAAPPDPQPLVSAAERRGMPLKVVRLDEPAVLDAYEQPLVLVRPDGHVAWRGNRPPADPMQVIDRVRGAAPLPSLPQWGRVRVGGQSRMQTMTTDLVSSPSLEALYQGLAPLSIGAGWAKPTPSLWPEPHKNFKPAMWRWADGRAALTAAGRLVNTELAERRNLILLNPVEGNTYATVRTLIAAYQSVLPGETTRSHRHTPNALRFILEGQGSYTVVNGEKLMMHPNDVLLTPNWCWHGHGAEGKEACFWLDCLDAPLVHMLEPMFFEQHPAKTETPSSVPTESPFIFPWDKVQAALDREQPNPDGHYGRRVQLGSPALASIALYMERLESGSRTRPLRTTANRIYCCAQGSGTTLVDGERFTWQRGDVIAAPAWRPVEHHAERDATLFCMTDEPLMRALGWLRAAN